MKNNSYTALAQFYDRFNTGADYKKTADCLKSVFDIYSFSPKLILDLACGTGNLTLELDSRRYDMIGLDLSADMLNAAILKKRKNKDGSILWLNQDMRGFELYGTVDAVVCCFDSLNYLPEEDGLISCIKCVHNYLNPGGVFVFDVNTLYKFEYILGSNDIIIEKNGDFCIWRNSFSKRKSLAVYELDMFIKNKDGSYKKYSEQQSQRYYKLEYIIGILLNAGFESIKLFYDYNPEDICGADDSDIKEFIKKHPKAERYYVACRKK